VICERHPVGAEVGECGERRVDYVELKELARLYKVPVFFFD
jgi:hypothetical protein